MPIKKVVKKPAVLNAEVEKDKKVVKAESTPVAIVDADGPVANVGFSASYTKNLGGYESVKVSVSLHMPVKVALDPAISNDDALGDAFVKV